MTGEDDGVCSEHPCAPHGFNRNQSHSEDRYVCDCEGWRPDRTCVGLELLQRAEAAEAALAARNTGVDCEALRGLLAKATEDNPWGGPFDRQDAMNAILRELPAFLDAYDARSDALSDLLSWFPEKPAHEWRIEAGTQGADDAIAAARANLEKGP